MPELPEVEVVRAGVEPAVTGAVVAAVDVFDDRSLRRHDRTAGPFGDLLQGRRILGAVRRGKFLWLPLESGRALLIHLGMSGQVLIRTPGSDDARQLRVRLHLEHPDRGELRFDFVDQRIFGYMAVDSMGPTGDGLPAGFAGASGGTWTDLIPSLVAHIARDPIDPAFAPDAFFAALARKRTGIKRAMLDQTLVSGIGNIYADEALFAARLHYDQPAGSLSPARARTLLGAVRTILDKALAEGGTSFDEQYVNVVESGSFFSASPLSAPGQKFTPGPPSPWARVVSIS